MEPTKDMVKDEETPGLDDVDIIMNELTAAQRRMEEWVTTGERVLRLYRGEGDGVNKASDRYNILWAITETQRPFVYSQQPKPIVKRRFLEPDEPARVAAEIIERALDYSMECEGHEFHRAMERVVSDYLLPGRGTAWVSYDAEFEEFEEGLDEETGEPRMGERKAYEEVYLEYVYWKDFLHSDGRCWDDVWWVARGYYLTKHDLKEQFPKVAKDVPLIADLDKDEEHAYRKQYDRSDCARVWVFWNKRTKRVYKVAEGYDGLLEPAEDDPYGLEQFFPCPKPLYMIETTGSLEPIPEYKMYEKQAGEVNVLTDRISKLTSVTRAAALYDSNVSSQISKLVRGSENEFIACENFTAMQQAGGTEGAVMWLPIERFAQTSEILMVQREKNLQIIYENTGVVDILRGIAVPRETKGAAEARASYASGRLAKKQSGVERFAQQALALMGELIAEHFDPDTLLMLTGIHAGILEQQGMGAVMEILRNDLIRGFKIEVETDSTIARDSEREKAELSEFLQGLSSFLGAATQAVGGGVMTPDQAKELILFATRKFRAGRQLEETLQKMGQQPPPQQPDPKVEAEKMKMQIEQQKLELEKTKIEGDQAIEAQKLLLQQAELAQKGQIEGEKIKQKHIEALINRDTARINASGGNSRVQ